MRLRRVEILLTLIGLTFRRSYRMKKELLGTIHLDIEGIDARKEIEQMLFGGRGGDSGNLVSHFRLRSEQRDWKTYLDFVGHDGER